MKNNFLQILKLPVLYNIQISEHIKLRFSYLMSGNTDNIHLGHCNPLQVALRDGKHCRMFE